jgi:small nuclear ribonucleoprotein (snRNP)-like protein
MEEGGASEGKDPSTFLAEITGAPVTVKLNSGVVYKGQSSRFPLGLFLVTNDADYLFPRPRRAAIG